VRTARYKSCCYGNMRKYTHPKFLPAVLASQLSLAKASERPLVARINLHYAPGKSTTIDGKFDDWVRSIHS
jgi:hypothetical protein